MDLASDRINCEALLRRLPSSLASVGRRLMDLTLLMMDLVGSGCQMQKRTFGAGRLKVSIFYAPQLFLCVKKKHIIQS